MMRKILVLCLVLLMALPAVLAKEDSMKLLAVSLSGNDSYKGSLADMKLEIQEGKGRVFIDSFPLTKIDTQITTRTAKQIACDYLDIDCSKYDFFYTIRSSAAIVGGPSAGAATTVLTIAVLSDMKLDKNVTMTGTINAGNIVGSVSAIKEKIEGAAGNGITKIIVPYGERYVEEGNTTIDLVEYGKKLGIEIFEASDIDDALEIFLGRKLKEKQRNFTISEDYIKTMSKVSTYLCDRGMDILSTTLEAGYSGANIINNESVELEEQAFNLTQKARDSMQRKEFYSAASYCYGANVIYSQMLILEQNISYQSLNKTIDKLAKDIEEFENKIDGSEKKTITDLESYMIAKQRLYEAKQNIEEFKSLLPNETMQYSSAAASSIERFNSAKSWFEFYGTSGAEIQIDKEAIKQSCIDKISEAEERYQYVDLYYPGLITSILGELAEAQKYFDSGNYELCLFTASKTKAEIDAVMSTIGVSDSKIDLLIDQRLKAAEKIIAEQNAKGYFPIFGYSYYEYALNLKRLNQSKPTALVYTQYAIELSKLDIYFKKKEPESKIKFDPELLRFGLVFLGGFVVGVAVYDLIIRKRGKKRKKKRH